MTPTVTIHVYSLRQYSFRGGPGLPKLTPHLQRVRQQLTVLSPEVTTHLDPGYDGSPCRAVLSEFGCTGAIARKGTAAPVQVGKRWPVER